MVKKLIAVILTDILDSPAGAILENAFINRIQTGRNLWGACRLYKIGKNSSAFVNVLSQNLTQTPKLPYNSNIICVKHLNIVTQGCIDGARLR